MHADKDGDEPGLGRLAYGYPDPDELHKLLDEAEVSRKISMDSGATWRTYSVAERLKILVGGYKLAVREGDEAERVGWNKALDRAALIAECATPDDGREHESCPFCGTSRQILELKASAAEPSKLAKILAEARASEDYRKEAERLSTPSAGVAFTDDDLRRMWKAAGGTFHGPNVEHGTMPEENLLRFLREITGLRPRSAREASGDGVTIPARLAAHLHGALSDAPLTKKCGVCQEIVALVAPQASIGPGGVRG